MELTYCRFCKKEDGAMKKKILVSFVSLFVFALACNLPGSNEPIIDQAPEEVQEQQQQPESAAPPGDVVQPPPSDAATSVQPVDLIQPEDLVYMGAFRLPDVPGDVNWDYSGHALTYYPDGDPDGGGDGYSGSLFGVGHDHYLYVSEISIPAPVISKNLDDLNTAETLQPFADITDGMFVAQDMVLPRAGLEYLPAQDGQSSDKLHFAFAQHIQDFEASHGWAELDLSNPQPEGPWVFDGYTNYATNDYIFEIPQEWSDLYAPGMRLATGRFREGVWGGFGPALFAYAPWQDGGPPAPNANLGSLRPLLLYGVQEAGNSNIYSDESMMMDGYGEADHWWGGAWLTAGERSAVAFVGTNATGRSWYGFANGVEWVYDCADQNPPTCPEYPEFPYDNRGYWADGYQGQIIFFDPADLAAVAIGQMETFAPQPYSSMDLTPYLFDPELDHFNYKRDLIGAAAFDRQHGLLFVVERLADEYKSVIHVFEVGG
jgi:hypothetical protein